MLCCVSSFKTSFLDLSGSEDINHENHVSKSLFAYASERLLTKAPVKIKIFPSNLNLET